MICSLSTITKKECQEAHRNTSSRSAKVLDGMAPSSLLFDKSLKKMKDKETEKLYTEHCQSTTTSKVKEKEKKISTHNVVMEFPSDEGKDP
jgi:hypothetical protein